MIQDHEDWVIAKIYCTLVVALIFGSSWKGSCSLDSFLLDERLSLLDEYHLWGRRGRWAFLPLGLQPSSLLHFGNQGWCLLPFWGSHLEELLECPHSVSDSLTSSSRSWPTGSLWLLWFGTLRKPLSKSWAVTSVINAARRNRVRSLQISRYIVRVLAVKELWINGGKFPFDPWWTCLRSTSLHFNSFLPNYRVQAWWTSSLVASR